MLRCIWVKGRKAQGALPHGAIPGLAAGLGCSCSCRCALGLGTVRAGRRWLNRQMLGFSMTYKPPKLPTMRTFSILQLQGGRITTRVTMLDVGPVVGSAPAMGRDHSTVENWAPLPAIWAWSKSEVQQEWI